MKVTHERHQTTGSLQVLHYKQDGKLKIQFFATLTRARGTYREIMGRRALEKESILISDIRDAITRIEYRDRAELIGVLNDLFNGD